MALPYIVGTKVAYTDGTSAASITFDDWFTGQQTDDWFMVIAHNDTGTNALSVSGWTEQISAAPNNSSSRCGVWAVRHTGSTITVPTVTGTNAAWRVLALHIRGAGATLLDAASARTSQTVSTTALTLPSITTTNNDCLIIRVIGMDGAAFSNWDNLIAPCVNLDRGSDTAGATGACELQVWYENARTAGAVPSRTLTRGVSDGGTLYTLAIIGSNAGAAMPEIIAPSVTVHYNGAQTVPTWTDISTLRATLNGVSTASCTISTSINTLSTDYFVHGCVHNLSVTPNTSSNVIIGAYTTLGAPVNMSSGTLSALLRSNSGASFGTEGIGIYFEDNVGQWKTLMVLPKSLGTTYYTYFGKITSEAFTDTSAGAIDWTNISRIGLFYRKVSAGTTAQTLSIGRVCNISGAVTVVGGSATNPITPAWIAGALTGQSVYGMASVQAGSQAAVCVPVTIGDTIATYYKAQGQALAIPAAGSTSFKLYRLAAQDLTLTYKAVSGDTISNTGSVFAPAVLQNLTFDPATSASATYDLGGVVATSAVTLATNAAVVGATFTDCTKITGKGCAVTGCRILATRASDAAISFDTSGASIVGTTIDITGKTVSYHVELGTSVTAFDATDAVFTGTPQTNQIHVLKTTGTVTITLARGQTRPTVTSAGATIAWNQPVNTGQVTSIAAGSRIQVYNVTTATEIANEVVAGTSWSLTYDEGNEFSENDVIRVRLTKAGNATGKKPYQNLTVATSVGWSMPASQEDATIYNSIGIDGSTVTEFAEDYPNVQIDVSDGDGSTTVQRLFAWWRYVETTTSGIRDWFGGLDADDAVNFRIYTSVLNLKLDNVTASPVKFTGGRLYRDDGATVIAATSGSIQLDPDKAYTVSVAGTAPTESQIKSWVRAELSTEMARIDVATSTRMASGATVNADVKYVNGVQVAGTGQTGDEWGPA